MRLRGVRRAVDVQTRPVAPHVGVADLHRERLELLEALRPGRVGHPGARLERAPHLDEDLVDHLLRALLRARRELLRDVALPERLADVAADRGEHALVALLLLLLALDPLAVERERLVVDHRGEGARCRAHDVEREVGAQRRQVGRGDDLGDRGEVVGRLHVDRLDAVRPHRREVRRQRRARARARTATSRVKRFRVRPGSRRSSARSWCAARRVSRSSTPGGELERLLGLGADVDQLGGDVVDVGGAQLDGRVARAVVGVAVGQAEPGLREPEQVAGRVVVVDGHAPREERRDPAVVQRRQQREDVGVRGRARDGVEERLDRGEPGGLDGLGVHAGGEVVAEHPVEVVRGALGGTHQEVVQHRLVAGVDLLDRPPRAVAGGDDGDVEPPAVGEAVEVDARVDGRVAVGGVQAHAVLLSRTLREPIPPAIRAPLARARSVAGERENGDGVRDTRVDGVRSR